MLIRNVKVANFKSFEKLDLELGRFNVLIGANASGKSNFVNILRFVKDAAESGLDNAISMQGGTDYVRNVNIGASQNLSVGIRIDCTDDPVQSMALSFERDERRIMIYAREFGYRFGIKFYKRKRGYQTIADEVLTADCDFAELEVEPGKLSKTPIGQGRIVLVREDGYIDYDLERAETPLTIDDLVPPLFLKPKGGFLHLAAKELMLESSIPFPPLLFDVAGLLRGISIFDLDPKLSKRATLVSGKTELESDGSNLAIVIRRILEDRKTKQRMSDLMRDLLPFIQDMKVQRLADKSLLATLKEVYSGDKFLPAFLISDGTMNVAALIVALYIERKPLVVVEEPERSIHPHLISRVVAMMKDVSDNLNKQVIVTTHNPEVVKHAGIDNILLVHRDDKGFSTISRPSDKEQVKVFLENRMGIDELYVQNLLEW